MEPGRGTRPILLRPPLGCVSHVEPARPPAAVITALEGIELVLAALRRGLQFVKGRSDNLISGASKLYGRSTLPAPCPTRRARGMRLNEQRCAGFWPPRVQMRTPVPYRGLSPRETADPGG